MPKKQTSQLTRAVQRSAPDLLEREGTLSMAPSTIRLSLQDHQDIETLVVLLSREVGHQVKSSVALRLALREGLRALSIRR